MNVADLRKKFVDTISSHTDPPIEFIEATSYGLISKTLGRFYYLKELGYRPNTYILLSSPPRATRRGELVNCMQKVANAAYRTYHKKIDNEKTNIDNEIKSNMLDGGSPQGLIDDINGYKENKINCHSVLSTEFGKRLSAIISGYSYMRGMDALLCKLYTGEADYESFSAKQGESRYLEEGAYFNLFGTLQEIGQYITDDNFFKIGLARRTSIFYHSKQSLLKRERKPLFGRDVSSMYEELEDIGERIGVRMHKLKANHYVTTPKNIQEFLSELDIKVTNQMLENDSKFSEYKQGRVDQIIKFSMNKAISANRKQITMDDVKEVKDLLSKNSDELEGVLNVPSGKRKKEEHLKKLLNLIATGKTHTERLRYFTKMYGLHADDLQDLYKILLLDGKIQRKDGRKGDNDYEIRV